MGSTATAYRNSDAATTGKTGKVFHRETLESLFDACDLRPNHFNVITAMWRAAGRPQGKEILLFAAVDGYRIEARYKSRRSVQRNLRSLEKLGVIELVKAANTIRRPATYRLRIDKLGKRQNYADVKNRRKAPTPITDFPAASPDHAVAPAPRATAPAAPPPSREESAREFLRAKQGISHTEKKPRQISRREAASLVAKMAELMRGHTRQVEAEGGYSYSLSADDPRYRAPMSQESALISACMTLCIPRSQRRKR